MRNPSWEGKSKRVLERNSNFNENVSSEIDENCKIGRPRRAAAERGILKRVQFNHV